MIPHVLKVEDRNRFEYRPRSEDGTQQTSGAHPLGAEGTD
jgi:hypothetical protein